MTVTILSTPKTAKAPAKSGASALPPGTASDGPSFSSVLDRTVAKAAAKRAPVNAGSGPVIRRGDARKTETLPQGTDGKADAAAPGQEAAIVPAAAGEAHEPTDTVPVAQATADMPMPEATDPAMTDPPALPVETPIKSLLGKAGVRPMVGATGQDDAPETGQGSDADGETLGGASPVEGSVEGAVEGSAPVAVAPVIMAPAIPVATQMPVPVAPLPVAADTTRTTTAVSMNGDGRAARAVPAETALTPAPTPGGEAVTVPVAPDAAGDVPALRALAGQGGTVQQQTAGNATETAPPLAMSRPDAAQSAARPLPMPPGAVQVEAVVADAAPVTAQAVTLPITGNARARTGVASVSAFASRLSAVDPSAAASSAARPMPTPVGEATALLGMVANGIDDTRPLSAVDASTAALAAPLPVAMRGDAGAQLAGAPVDIAASLGQQVIDMSSGGQWIDGLAKEIATLAAGTGQGSFRLSPENLGPMRVEIRGGDTGSEVRLMVETEAAEAALSKDSDRLKADARLSSIRISDVTVERLPRLSESARSENSAGQQQGQGQNHGHGSTSSQSNGAGQSGTQAGLGQGGQTSGQNAQGQQAGGQPSGRKVSGDAAVLSSAEPVDQAVADGTSALRRARYA